MNPAKIIAIAFVLSLMATSIVFTSLAVNASDKYKSCVNGINQNLEVKSLKRYVGMITLDGNFMYGYSVSNSSCIACLQEYYSQPSKETVILCGGCETACSNKNIDKRCNYYDIAVFAVVAGLFGMAWLVFASIFIKCVKREEARPDDDVLCDTIVLRWS